MVITYSKGKDQPGKVANPARGQLNRQMNFPLSPFAQENLVSRQEYDVGEKPTVRLYTYINRYAGSPNKTKTRDTMTLDTAQVCYIWSRIGWVSALLYYQF